VLDASELTRAVASARPVCTVTDVGTCVQVTASGELDLAAGNVLRDAAGRIVLAPGRVVVLDLTGASFVDSSVVHFALDLERRAADHRAGLVVVARATTKRLFALTGADDVRVVEDEHRDGADGARRA
jgi:anti-anti-sigma factor